MTGVLLQASAVAPRLEQCYFCMDLSKYCCHYRDQLDRHDQLITGFDRIQPKSPTRVHVL
jgi:hypothetical protein